MTKPPAFQFYPADFKLDTDDMTAEQVGAYIRLLCVAWKKHGIPDDPSAQAHIAGISSRRFASSVWPAIAPYWGMNGNGRMVNQRQETERKKQEEWRQKSAKGGRASAQAKGKQ